MSAPGVGTKTHPAAAAGELAEVPCGLCGSRRYRVLLDTPLLSPSDQDLAEAIRCTSDRYHCFGRIVRCLDRGLVRRCPRETDIEAAYAAVADELHLENEDARHATFAGTLGLMQAAGDPTGRLLDVGCYVGIFLSMARERGWDVQGLEPSRWAAEMARSRYGLDVVSGAIAQATWPEGYFHTITLWDVLEHLSDPLAGLETVGRWLAPGGRLWLSTMDTSAALPRLLGRRWPHCMRMHLWYFSRDTLGRMLSAAGLTVSGTWRHTRVLRIGYLAQRLHCMGRLVGAAACATVRLTGLADRHVSIRSGDIITVMAVPADSRACSPEGIGLPGRASS